MTLHYFVHKPKSVSVSDGQFILRELSSDTSILSEGDPLSTMTLERGYK